MSNLTPKQEWKLLVDSLHALATMDCDEPDRQSAIVKLMSIKDVAHVCLGVTARFNGYANRTIEPYREE